MALDRTYFNTLTDGVAGTPVDKAMIDAIYDDVDAALALIPPVGTPTNWTVIDGSGAALTITNNTQAKAIKIGQLVIAFLDINYPATANGSNAVLGGLPYTAHATAYGAFVFSRMSESTLKQGQISPSGTTITLYDQTGSNVTNATMSGDLIKGMAVYLASS